MNFDNQPLPRTGVPSRGELIAMLEQNDPNGVYRDEDMAIEGSTPEPWSDENLLTEARAQYLVMPAHCQYFADAYGSEYQGECANPVDASVEPAPAGQFSPALLCAEHANDWIDDHIFHLGTEWSITPVSEDAKARLNTFPHTTTLSGPLAALADDPSEAFCEECGHPMGQHAFFPADDAHKLGEPAPLCVGNDSPPVSDACDCEGFVLFPKA